jgi:hypothetical protein
MAAATPTMGGSGWGLVDTGGGGWGNALLTAGWYASVFSTASMAVNAWYQADAQKNAMKAQASAFDHQQTMSRINAQAAESDAQALLAQGENEMASLTLQHGQQRGNLLAGQAASGTEAGGSNAEVRASQRYIQRLEAMTLDSNTVRAANAARARGVNAVNQATMAGASAANLRNSAAGIDPWYGVAGSLTGSAGNLASQWAYRERYRGRR